MLGLGFKLQALSALGSESSSYGQSKSKDWRLLQSHIQSTRYLNLWRLI